MGKTTEAMIQAVVQHQLDAVKALLEQNPGLASITVYHRDFRGEPLLNCIIPDAGNDSSGAVLAIARLLLEHGANPNEVGFPPNNEGGTALHHAAWTNQAALVQLLCEYDADTEIRNYDGERAIDNAARHGNTEAVQVLMEAGSPYTIFHVVQAGMLEHTARLLQQKPNSIHQRDTEGVTVMHHLLGPESRYNSELLTLLLEAGADLEARDEKGRTTLHAALDARKKDAVAAVLAHGASVDIFAAAGLGDRRRVLSILEQDSTQAQAQQADGLTPLFYAVRFGHLPIVELLLKNGIEVNTYVERWWMEPTPLHSSAMYGETEICRLLLDHGADVKRKNELGYTPLLVAARWTHVDTVSLLLDYGANIHAQDGNGISALDWAAWGGHLSLGQLLLSRGFNVNLKGPAGSWSERTALHFAIEHDRTDFVQLLLNAGADRKLTNQAGQTAHEIAAFYGRTDIAALLQTTTF